MNKNRASSGLRINNAVDDAAVPLGQSNDLLRVEALSEMLQMRYL